MPFFVEWRVQGQTYLVHWTLPLVLSLEQWWMKKAGFHLLSTLMDAFVLAVAELRCLIAIPL
jgi:hypothetical protein